MATMTITIAVSTKGFTWSRTASIADVTAAVTHISEQTSADAVFGGVEAAAVGDGLHSFNAIAVGCLVNSGSGSILKVLTSVSGGTQTGGVAIPPGIPFIVYNGAGTGFTGGVSTGASNTITPTDDVQRLQFGSIMGSSVAQVLLGLKATS
jgi:hypothetical protein